jgi:hypothetical protein
MPLTHEVDPSRRIVIVTVSGDLGDEQLFELHDEIRKNREVKSDFGLLIDLRQARGRNITSSGVGALAELPLVLSAKARRAVVVPSDFGFGMARMYSLLREAGNGGIAVFRDFAEARRWIENREQ